MSTVTFATATQAALFEHELKGQISDGFWENTANTSWKMWCNADVVVGENVGRNGFRPRKDNFAFNNKTLIEIIGERMINIARLANYFGFDSDVKIRKIEGVCKLKNGELTLVKYDGKYWDEQRAYVEEIGIDRVKAALEDTAYSTKELMSDLRDIKKAIKTVV